MLALPLALSIGMVDRPGGHKSHVGDVPVIGGIAMYLGAVVGMVLLSELDPRSSYLLLAGGISCLSACSMTSFRWPHPYV
jgi:UDP-GlcNAc:undecaprenyl-phosphate GlcNAc-1-phosphate transferase